MKLKSLLWPLAFATLMPVAAAAADMTVFKSPYCGCCVGWVKHMQAHGFDVEVRDVQDTGSVKQRLGIARELASCHTAVIDGYVIEGHVPAQDVRRLLELRPQVKGLAVPGMPIGSPGMEGPNPQPYSVLSFDAQGRTEVFARH